MKKKLIKILSAAIAVVFALGVFAGCDLLVTDNRRDMEQVVAEVNIGADTEALSASMEAVGSELDADISSAIGEIVSQENILKRDLIVYFMSYGYNYVSSDASDYSAAFESILDDLVENKILSQFATIYYLNAGEVRVDRDRTDLNDKGYTEITEEESGIADGLRMNKDLTVEGYKAAIGDKTGDEASVAAYSYFLTEDEINYANYVVMSSINGAIDSYEEDIIAEMNDTTTSSDSRTTPTGANTISSTYYPSRTENGAKVVDYGIYTGYNTISECGDYEKVNGSTTYTRRRAYARFLNALRLNYLVQEDEDVSMDVTELSYFTVELETQLEQRLLNKFIATLSLLSSENITQDTLQSAYNIELTSQTESNKRADSSTFISTMDSLSDTSFVLYSPDGRQFGYVYNILIPFNAGQTLNLAEVGQHYTAGTAAYYAARNSRDSELYDRVEATDQRGPWFNGSTDYSYVAEGDGYYKNAKNSAEDKENYLFFEDSFVTSANEEGEVAGIDRYAGRYPYNGSAVQNNDDTYTLTPFRLNIDEFIDEMEAYIDWYINYSVSGASGTHASGSYYSGKDASGAHVWNGTNGDAFYETTTEDFQKVDETTGRTTVDQSANIYYKGSVAGVEGSAAATYLTEGSTSYAALSAFNELMFAYSTDTGCLNTYYGYSIASSEDATDYVAEFEFAAQEAIKEGIGTYYVVATDYGWHILYVSFAFNGGVTYADGFIYSERNVEGTFSYYYYQAKKSSLTSSDITDVRNNIFTELNSSDVVSRYPSRYANLSSISTN